MSDPVFQTFKTVDDWLAYAAGVLVSMTKETEPPPGAVQNLQTAWTQAQELGGAVDDLTAAVTTLEGALSVTVERETGWVHDPDTDGPLEQEERDATFNYVTGLRDTATSVKADVAGALTALGVI